ncbi:hypothetical protein [Mycolicibacterium fortuitum]|uniref:Uncharacterized protein n=2 Tax=Mycolicibacterium fortuitum TaxID=1766 RepID=A0AAE4VI63_MYCFO|nr:hypothetical protein [Mycolicibacterium fortuitum]MCV7137895.1 hypothetical protein [Mycolicibacterium fortuitum]MDV7195387.1 hypothetical protein [Mycolicibacterium fortuitum]MDV7209094.1 hypothetical protein [Mycolicibacterium fortuitum]MDV7229215.1 hypothetical protein [Mycolicibacterium fortuitum]MDV7260914.1 hypothetical protein [Mycolicibacterium fortuitum]
MYDDQDAASALEIVEDFFKLKIDHPMFDISPDIPADQLTELARRIDEHAQTIEGSRAPMSEMLAGVYASDDVALLGGRSKPRGKPVSSIPDLKLQLAVCDRAVVPDLLLAWAFDVTLAEDWGEHIDSAAVRDGLVAALRQLRPIASAIRAGYLVSIPPADRHRLNPGYRSALSDLAIGTWDFARHDPVARHLLQSRLGYTDFQLQQSFTGAELLRSVEDGLYLGVPPDVGSHLLEEYGANDAVELAEACHFWTLCSTFRTQPMVRRQAVARHFRWAAQLAATKVSDHRIAATADEQPQAGAAPALELALPSLNNLTVEQLVGLRKQEAIWAELRSALTAAAVAASDLHFEDLDYLAFLQAVRECTQDIAGPAAQKLGRDLRRNKWKSIGIAWTGAGLVRLAVHGVGLLFPAANALGAPASNTAKSWLTQAQQGRQQAYETASTLMLDLSMNAP